MQAVHTITSLNTPEQTAREMVRLVKTYAKDIGNKESWTLKKFYEYVRALPFRPDPVGHETVSRPSLTMRADYPWRDCDDKAILLGSWCYLNRVPFQFRASSKHPSKRLHHVYTICFIDGKEICLDATYPQNELGREENYTKISNLTEVIMHPTLNTLEGFPQAPKWKKRSFQKIRSGLKRAGKIEGRILFSPDENIKTLSGDEFEDLSYDQAQLLGSFISKVKRKAGKVAKKTGKLAKKTGSLVKKAAKSKVVRAAVGAAIPGAENALLALTGKKKSSGNAVSSFSAFPSKNAVLIGGGVAALLVLFLVTRSRRAA